MKTPLERFTEKYIVKENGCWEWGGVKGGSGVTKYGYIQSNVYKRKIPAARFSYEMFIGKIPEGHIIRKKCEDSLCVNPEHLYLENKILNGKGISRFNQHVPMDGGPNYNPAAMESGVSKKRFLKAVKQAAGCMDCRQDFFEFPNVLDFDHRYNEIKLFNLGHVSSQSWEVIIQEIEKCDVVCSNCHRIRTAKRSRKGR